MTVYYPQWRNENSLRQFPFEDSASCVSSDGKLQLPNTWLVDAAFFVRSIKLPLRLGSVKISGNAAELSIIDNSGAAVGSATAIKNDLKPIRVTDSLGRWCGTLVPWTDANFALFTAGEGEFQFGIGDSEFVVSCVLSLPSSTGLAALTNDIGQTYSLGDLILVGESGVQLEMTKATEFLTNGQTVEIDLLRIHAMGDPQYLHALCTADDTRRPARFIKRVVFQYGTQMHSCTPDELGNILVLANTAAADSSALQVLSTPTGINIRLPGKGIG